MACFPTLRALTRALACAGALALASGCSGRFGSVPPPMSVAEEIASSVQIDTVTSAELGRSHRGFVLSAIGSARGDGWRAGRLKPRAGGVDAEGNLDFDFVALPPPPPEADSKAAAPTGLTQRLRADMPLEREQLHGVRSLRVFGRENSARVTLQAPSSP